jgi:hypothetical protein
MWKMDPLNILDRNWTPSKERKKNLFTKDFLAKNTPLIQMKNNWNQIASDLKNWNFLFKNWQFSSDFES